MQLNSIELSIENIRKYRDEEENILIIKLMVVSPVFYAPVGIAVKKHDRVFHRFLSVEIYVYCFCCISKSFSMIKNLV